MEVTVQAHQRIAVSEPSQVGEARRAGAALAQACSFDEVSAGRLALVITELGNNLVRFARGGFILIGRTHPPSASSIDVLAVDHGPGMPDIDRCMQDGYSTGGTPGTGMGAVRRLSSAFSVYSDDEGSIVLARVLGASAKPATTGIHVGAVALAAKGETVCGDAWSAREQGSSRRLSLLVADGLGHGPQAAEAACRAVESFASLHGGPADAVRHLHAALRSSRGAAACVADLDADGSTIVCSGAGNIVGRVISGVTDRTIMTQHGTLGFQIRTPQAIVYDWPEHASLILHSDGILSRWKPKHGSGLLQCDPAVIAAWLVRDHARGTDDVTAVVAKRRQPERAA